MDASAMVEGVSLAELADLIGARLERGDGAKRLLRVASLEDALADSLSFLATARQRRYLAHTRAGAVILRERDLAAAPVAALVCDDPHLAFARAAQHLTVATRPRAGIHPTAWVHPEATLEAGVAVGPHASIDAGAYLARRVSVAGGCVIGAAVEIGEDTCLLANVTIYPNTIIGRRVIIHSGAVLGCDGFGYANDAGRWVKVPQLGRVIIGDDVEIGANTAVDRGALGDTVIEEGVKIDNLVQVAHNARVGAHTAMAGCSAISGGTRVGKYCRIAGGAGLTGHLRISDGTQVTGMTMITHDIREPGSYSSGTQMTATRLWRRNAVRFNELDEMARRLRRLERQLFELQARNAQE
ncbi:MAG: UDP-3-O-(3-hydroxymyristoyl)glucosamine N-acyltransferase [Nitrococcus sp.]|nr:UDP-3-O-(3-hydroxymyristoyl)glucosamine N-acyltransferase [Nitrococcus sp.]